ncbi:MAG: hypothetical protein WBB45_20165 [Cyclobacteriaceae bacterium]
MNEKTLMDIRVQSTVTNLKASWDQRLSEEGYDYHVPYGNTSPHLL